MKFFQVVFLFGVLGLSLWGLARLSSYVKSEGTDKVSLAESLAKSSPADESNSTDSSQDGSTGSSNSTTAKPDQDSAENPVDAEKNPDEQEKKPDDYHATNPFAMADKSGPHPRAEMPEKSHTFEAMVLGTTGQRDFILKNTGDAPLKVAKGPTMCKCTLSQVKEQEVPPGGEIKIGLEWKPTAAGEFSQSAVIWTNDPDHPEFSIAISGNMFAEVSFLPAAGWMLGSMPVGVDVPFMGFVYSSVDDTLEIEEMTSTSDQVQVSYEQVPPEQVDPAALDPDARVTKAFKITGKVLASDIAGQVRESIVIKTNKIMGEETRLPVQLNRTGPISIVCKGWVAEQQLLQLGRIKSDTGLTQKMTVLVDAFDQDLQLENIKSDLPFVTLELKKENSPPDARKHRYTLLFKVAKGAPLGEWTGPKRATVAFDTNHPKVPKFEIHADFEVL